MEQPAQKYRDLRPFPVDVVITPFLDYMVIGYKDPSIQKHPEMAGGVFDFSGAHILGLAPKREDLESCISGFLEQHPDLKIEGERVMDLNMPSGSLSYIFSQGVVREIGAKYRESIIQLSKKPRVHVDVPSTEESESYVRHFFTWGAWEQLIRKSSQNYLQFYNDTPPQYLILDEQWRGFALIGGGMGGNNGYGLANIFFYLILDNGVAEASENGLFKRKTLQVEHLLTTTIGSIPMAFTTPEQFKELTQKGRVINFGNWPTFIRLDKSMLDRLGGLDVGLKQLQLE